MENTTSSPTSSSNKFTNPEIEIAKKKRQARHFTVNLFDTEHD